MLRRSKRLAAMSQTARAPQTTLGAVLFHPPGSRLYPGLDFGPKSRPRSPRAWSKFKSTLAAACLPRCPADRPA